MFSKTDASSVKKSENFTLFEITFAMIVFWLDGFVIFTNDSFFKWGPIKIESLSVFSPIKSNFSRAFLIIPLN